MSLASETIGILCGVVYVTLRLAILVQLQLVTI